MRSRLLLSSLPLLVLAGCGGSDGGGVVCSTIVSYTPNAAYVGPFTGTIMPGGETSALSVAFSVAADGSVTGTATNTSGVSVAVTGKADDYRNTCDNSQVAIVLDYTPSGGTAQELNVYKKRNGSLPGLYKGDQFSDGSNVAITLSVSNPPVAG